MRDNLSRAGKTILIMLVVVLSVAYVNNHKKSVVVFVQDPNIPSQREIQQRLEDLNDPRYDPNGVDGWIGTDSRTAWDNYTKDQHAKEYFK